MHVQTGFNTKYIHLKAGKDYTSDIFGRTQSVLRSRKEPKPPMWMRSQEYSNEHITLVYDSVDE